jgi:uncharacterized membrane protein YsdA (DUF1294 family)/cold shock CspA family protein
MRSTGRISKWKDDKGFGFIVPDGGGDELFAHISEVNAEGRRPAAGDRVSYAVGSDRSGRRCARQVLLDGVPLKTARARGQVRDDHPAQWGGATLFAIPAFLIVMLVAAWLWQVPAGWFLLYLGLSVVTFGLYAVDKAQAARDGMRVPEARLHLLALVGGWPGGLLAQQFLRHKSVKASFRRGFWITVALNVLIFLFVTSPLGRPLVAHWLG